MTAGSSASACRSGKSRPLMLRMTPRIRRFVTGLAAAALTLLCLEVTAYLLNPQIEYIFEPPLHERDKLLGYKLKPQLKVRGTNKRNGEILYNVTYSTDEYGRRITPAQDSKAATRFILFFGCSLTFGEGVEDNETLPFRVSEIASKYKVYNYGVGGYGPQHMLVKLQSPQLPSEIKERDGGILVYTFIDHHIPRAIGWMQILSWGSHFPYYVMDDGDRLIRKGSFTSGRPLLTYFYVLMWKSHLVKYLNSRLRLPRIGDEHIKLTVRIIEESRNTFRERFHSERFYVLIYPENGQYGRKLIPYLERAGIKYLDYSRLTDQTLRDKIPNDSHPSARSYRAVALKITEDIGVLAGSGK